MTSLHISPVFVARASRCRRAVAHNPMCFAHRGEGGAGVVVYYVKPPAGSTARNGEHIDVRSRKVARYAG